MIKGIKRKGTGKSGALSFFVLAIAMAIVTGLTAYSTLQKAAPTTQVIVAAREIPAYTLITSEDVAVKSVPGGGVPDGAITDLSGGSVVGRYATRGLMRGDIIREGHLSDEPMLAGPLAAKLTDPLFGSGRIALSLPGDLAPGIISELIPGDRVVALGYVSGGQQSGAQQLSDGQVTGGSHTQIEGLGVLAPSAAVLRVVVPIDEVGSMSIRESTMVLSVTENEALSILRAITDGVVSLALLPPQSIVKKGVMRDD